MKSLYLEDLDLNNKNEKNVGMRNLNTHDTAKALKIDGYNKWKIFNAGMSCTMQTEH